MSEKTKPTDLIASIKVGGEDSSGNKVVKVLANANEYSIYEIESKDINDRLRVLIDGHTDQSEEIIANRYRAVKQKYIEAKGLLYRSNNFGMMKNRVAHALATALSSDADNPNTEFQLLIDEIKTEAQTVVMNRLSYFATAFFVSLFTFAILFFCENYSSPMLLAFGASLGAAMSMLIGVGEKHFEEFQTRYYLMLGGERIFFAYVATAILFALVKAGIVLPMLNDSSSWGLITLGSVAGFSEQLIPSLLSKASKE